MNNDLLSSIPRVTRQHLFNLVLPSNLTGSDQWSGNKDGVSVNGVLASLDLGTSSPRRSNGLPADAVSRRSGRISGNPSVLPLWKTGPSFILRCRSVNAERPGRIYFLEGRSEDLAVSC